MSHVEWLKGEMERWKADGLVTAATAASIIARYPKSSPRHWGLAIAGGFAALLVSIGVISLLAANWDEFGRPLRAFISLVPMCAATAVAAWGARRAKEGRVFWEPAAILWFASVIAGISLVAQTYQLSHDLAGLFLCLTVVTWPIAWLTRSVSVGSVWFVLPILWCFNLETESVLLMPLVFYPVYVAGLASLQHALDRGSPQLLRDYADLAAGVAFAVATMRIVSSTAGNYGCGWHLRGQICAYAWFAVSMIVFWTGRLADRRGFRFLGTLFLCWCAIFTPYAEVMEELLGILVCGAGALWWLPYVAALGIAVFQLAKGLKTGDFVRLNLGFVLLLYLILARFFASDVSFTVKGLIFLGAGISLAAVNFVTARRIRRGKEGV